MKEDNGYRLEVIVDKNYLKEAEYPITVDPSAILLCLLPALSYLLRYISLLPTLFHSLRADYSM